MSVIESTIDGRYQVITRIASGGMGEVFRAQDAVLGRDVAVKMLHAHLASDRGFVDRFRREARAAAILNHRNVVGVYDWGSTDGTYFMVMEFVRGHNLRALLSEYGRLEPGHVVEVGLQVLAALEHAHGHGIVHRDIKPENILIDQDGTVKVADFGLARAFAESSVSQSEGTVTGTVQYLAPEQVQGEPAGPRTDLYACGIVMFELLTGRPPFSGETSLGIAYQHLSSRVPPPSAVVPGTPSAVDRVVLHATERDPSRRPASARAFRDEVAGAGETLVQTTRVAELAAQIPTTEFVPEERAPTVTIPRAESPRRRRWRLIRRGLALLLLLAALTGGGWALWTYVVPHYADVPDVKGSTVAQANERLEAAGFAPRVGDQVFSAAVPAGQVIRTIPAFGARIEMGSPVELVLSKGPELFAVPSVKGESEAVARTMLVDAGFRVRVEQARHESVPSGRVIGQNPEARFQAERGTLVTITVSLGPPLVGVPGVAGRSAASAEGELRAAGFGVDRAEEYSTAVPAGTVIRVEPQAGARIPQGSTVTIVVSLGPRTFPMPNVQGMTREAGVEELESLGLEVRVTVIPSSSGNIVVGQTPAPGETVREGDTVTIYVLGP
jgi:beta-lactam-binding protein with PASTA domain/predicted Ser/Thr protein kinase